MGLSVGVVTIEYLEEPIPPVCDFLEQLKFDPFLGEQDFDYETKMNSTVNTTLGAEGHPATV